MKMKNPGWTQTMSSLIGHGKSIKKILIDFVAMNVWVEMI